MSSSRLARCLLTDWGCVFASKGKTRTQRYVSVWRTYCFTDWELLFVYNGNHIKKSTCLFSLACCFTDWELLFADEGKHTTNQHAHCVWHIASLIEKYCLRTRETTNYHVHSVWHTASLIGKYGLHTWEHTNEPCTDWEVLFANKENHKWTMIVQFGILLHCLRVTVW